MHASIDLFIIQANGSLGPVNHTNEKFAFLSSLAFVATEVHKAVGALFSGTPESKEHLLGNAHKILQYVNDKFLADKTFAYGGEFTVIDPYLYIVLSWTNYVGIDISLYPIAKAYFDRIGDLPIVKAAHARMETIPPTTI